MTRAAFITGILGALGVSAQSSTPINPFGKGPGQQPTNVATFVDQETPVGAIDGANPVYTVSAVPRPAASLYVWRCGLLMKAGVDYTLAGSTVSFLSASTPQTADVLTASFRT